VHLVVTLIHKMASVVFMIRIPYEEDPGTSGSDGERQPESSGTVREQGSSRQTNDSSHRPSESGVNNDNNGNETYQSFEHELSETNGAGRSSVDMENLTGHLNLAEVCGLTDMHMFLYFTIYRKSRYVHLSKSRYVPFTALRLLVRFLLRTHVKRVSQRSAESRGFSPGAPVSYHRES
jgi:hypothetical protein